MELSIQRINDNIMTTKTFDDAKDRGEIAHFIAELECLKKELIELFNDYSMENEKN